jgi:hypothetical protein
MSKVCTKCKVPKDLDEFYKSSRNSALHKAACKVCYREVSKAYGKAHYDKDVSSARSLAWLAAHPGKVAEYSKRHYRKGKKDGSSIMGWLIKTFEGTPCLDCEGVFEWCAMDFDHRPEETKEFGIGTMANRAANPKNIAKTEKEILKCDVVCSNCHRVRTRDRHEQG